MEQFTCNPRLRYKHRSRWAEVYAAEILLGLVTAAFGLATIMGW